MMVARVGHARDIAGVKVSLHGSETRKRETQPDTDTGSVTFNVQTNDAHSFTEPTPAPNRRHTKQWWLAASAGVSRHCPT